MRLFLWVLSCAFYCHAADFQKADELYSKRENNLEAIHEAIAIYRNILGQSQDAETRMRAMTFIGRLSFYEGELLTLQDNSDRRMEIFAALQEDAEQAGSLYWKALALGLWCRSAGVSAAWWYLADLKEILNRTLLEEPHVEEGGIYRMLAGVYSANSALVIYGLYDLDLALQYADQAVLNAPLRLEAYLIKSYVLRQSGRVEEAAALVRESISKFAGRTDLTPETKIYLQKAQQAVNILVCPQSLC